MVHLFRIMRCETKMISLTLADTWKRKQKRINTNPSLLLKKELNIITHGGIIASCLLVKEIDL